MIHLTSFVLVLGLVLANVANAADPSLVGWWKLNESSGTTANDSSGNENNGTLMGDPQWVAGKIGGALQFDGTDDYVEVPDSPSLDITDTITIVAWVFREVDSGAYERIVAKSASAGFDYWLHISTGDTTGGGFSDIGGSNPCVSFNAAPGTSIPLNQWTHLAFVYDGTYLKGYVDGQLDKSENIGSFTIRTSTRPLWVGRLQNTYDFDGLIDEVRIYSRALTEAEIQRAMKGREEGIAYDPSPANEATDVPRDVVLSWTPGEFADQHDVYFGSSFEDVNSTTNLDPMGPDNVYRARQAIDIYAVGETLDLGQTYYWRIDEVNAPPTSHVVFKGDVWQFTVEPVAYPIRGTSIIATASSSFNLTTGPENTVNGSGLDADDLHSEQQPDMWLSSMTAQPPTWIQYEFDKAHKLHEMWVWNFNQNIEPIVGFGLKDVTIEYSANGTDWTELAGVPEFARAPATPGYAHNTTFDFGGVAAK